MIQNIVWFSLHLSHDVGEPLNERVHSFNVQLFQHGELFNDREHVNDFLNTLTESIKFVEDVHFRKVKLLFLRRLLKFSLQLS